MDHHRATGGVRTASHQQQQQPGQGHQPRRVAAGRSPQMGGVANDTGYQQHQQQQQQHYAQHQGGQQPQQHYHIAAQHQPQAAMQHVHLRHPAQQQHPTMIAQYPAAMSGIHHPQPAAQLAHGQDLPLRMVVDAKYVGAIIGQGGSNIREITRESKARCVVDVQRALRDSSGNLEKVISIYGQPENCSKACMKVLDVVLREAEKEGADGIEPELKLRAHNQLVGRLIGRQGASIKKIMEDTNTVIFVSNWFKLKLQGASTRSARSHLCVSTPLACFSDPSVSSRPGAGGDSQHQMAATVHPQLLNELSSERTITVRGTVENIRKAEERISAKLRQSYESDLATGAASNGPFAAVPPHMLLPSGDHSFLNPAAGLMQFPFGQAGIVRAGGQPSVTEVVHMYVPNTMVGALIGTKGVHIRNVMRLTGAHIRIEGGPSSSGMGRRDSAGSKERKDAGNEDKSSDKQEGADQRKSPTANGDLSHNQDDRKDEERLVTITGNDQQQYKAQYWIYSRVAEQHYQLFEDVRLTVEVSVPSKLVGRIIGKGGQNVRELQRITSAHVKIPDDAADTDADETTVRISGNFPASQAVQCRLRQLVQQFHQQPQIAHVGRKD